MNIEQLKTVNETELADINNLMLQLAHDPTSFTSVTLSALKEIVEDEKLYIMVARDGAKIVGTATLITCMTLSGFDGEIDDVVVDEKYRGKGLGENLMNAVIDQARKLKVKKIQLSSRPSRVAANKLYQKLGFEQKETNVYRMKL